MDCGVISQPLEITNSRDRVATSLHTAYFAARGLRQRCILPGDPKVRFWIFVTALYITMMQKNILLLFFVVLLAFSENIFRKIEFKKKARLL